SGKHSGDARLGAIVARRTAEPTVPDALRQRRRIVSLRLLSYNIRFGGAGREQMLSAVIQACSPDIVILQEATRPEIVKRLANDCGMPQWGARLGHSLAWMSRIEVSGSAWHKVWFAKRSYLELAAGGLRVF